MIFDMTKRKGGGDAYELARKIASGTATEYIDNDITTLRGYAFAHNANLATLKVPNVTAVNGNCINGTGITTLILPKLTTTYGKPYSFAEAKQLKAADFSKLTNIVANVFKNNAKMDCLVIRTSSLCAGQISAFDGTPFASGKAGGTLYVPASLISSYESATNWSTILSYPNNQIKSIESTHTDPNAPVDLTLYYVDGTPIPTA